MQLYKKTNYKKNEKTKCEQSLSKKIRKRYIQNEICAYVAKYNYDTKLNM